MWKLVWLDDKDQQRELAGTEEAVYGAYTRMRGDPCNGWIKVLDPEDNIPTDYQGKPVSTVHEWWWEKDGSHHPCCGEMDCTCGWGYIWPN